MPILHAVVLGIVQGLSEFLPISSSGHLLVVPWLFDWNDFGGDAGLEKTFDVALHIGTLFALVAYFRGDLVGLVRDGLTKPKSRNGRLAWYLALSSVPAAITGALLSDFIDEHLGQIPLIATMLIVFGLVLLWADRAPGRRSIEEVRLRDVVLMGVGQALALQPGVSRSGVTMTAGRFAGLARDAAVRVAFLMSVPITAGAVLFKGVDAFGSDGTGIPDGFAAPFFWGIVASAVTGWLAVWGILRLVRTSTFTPFVIYRVLAGVAILGIFTAR
ncbi:MAG: undecaprenyl-diphosphate phosphatase [Acidimicrobiia bacterium]|nr:undecaprenyl-diphosphate phosphatase [Acidimicrobiia bacterium]